ncbi:hypothetical protein H704_01000 [Bartonella bacilliformis Peru38]|uniref:Iron chelate ABC transporter, periplasmic iron-binding protein n=2 Tax=Bartonella bacilliformis TaxID=774 RepID=A1UTS0_BARBK|nr:iron chelate ABC transporter, periplasmic iron-binding protein [Bartonella bacilliformis KC583]EYS88652.1 hypothetical protein X472_01204 [Bartonella bacilliformis San Pedro600-02]EYS94371.1 hypothetical protein X470_01074 [Bartonella bacilliformis Peru-18]KEG15858.1 hypothetical protein H709_00973 [Bartonella bacilliformis CUSCO5]KEG19762.1 hypothetical protein H704_01000 [Bartonella bacilliformis Peru38]
MMITKYIKWVASILAAVISLVTISLADITVDHTSGKTSVPLYPKKIVVYDLASLDNMVRLGVDATFGVIDGKKPTYLEYFNGAEYEKMGTRTDPNFEKIASFRPDLILVSSRVRSKYEDFSQIAPTLDMTVRYSTILKDIERNLTILGQIFGKEKEAKQEIATLHDALAKVRKKTQGKGKALVIMTSGGKISAFAPGGRFDLLHSSFGIPTVTDKISQERHGQLISPEFIFKHNPDWLLVVDRDAAIGQEGKSAAELLDHKLIHRTKAWEKGQIIYLDPQSWYLASGNLTGLHNTIKQIGDAFENSK